MPHINYGSTGWVKQIMRLITTGLPALYNIAYSKDKYETFAEKTPRVHELFSRTTIPFIFIQHKKKKKNQKYWILKSNVDRQYNLITITQIVPCSCFITQKCSYFHGTHSI